MDKKLFFYLTVFLQIIGFGTFGCKSQSVSPPTPSYETKTGLASFYGQDFQGQETASGEAFDKRELVAAHPTYPMGTKIRVTNITNNQSVEVRVNDRGPNQENQAEGVIIDLSKEAATKLEMVKDGRAKVKLEVVEWGKNQTQ
jgi:rare lipoprotein A